jgi:hypothetical protein
METRSQALKRRHSTLESSKEVLDELFHLLRSKPEEESLELLRRIRGQDDPEAIVKQVKDGDLLLQMALVPEARLRYQFPHVKEMPTVLQTPDNPYLSSMIYAWTVGSRSPPENAQSQQQSRYLKPFHAADLVDPVLDSVRPSHWTTVSTDDRFMRGLLSSYFLREHMWFTYINKDLFLASMAARSTSLCSPLLVNAVLAFACVSTPPVRCLHPLSVRLD